MSDSRPNIAFIVTDQQRFDTINALGYPYMDTPNLDRMVNEGVVFTNCFVPAPSCAPCRASLFSGQYPHNAGVMVNGDSWDRSWVELLAADGYHCVNVGKMHQAPYNERFGFHQRFPVENKDRYLDGRYFIDEWDKAIRARGHVKPGRLSYRDLPDYSETSRRVRMAARERSTFGYLCRKYRGLVVELLPSHRAPVLADRLPRAAPALRSAD